MKCYFIETHFCLSFAPLDKQCALKTHHRVTKETWTGGWNTNLTGRDPERFAPTFSLMSSGGKTPFFNSQFDHQLNNVHWANEWNQTAVNSLLCSVRSPRVRAQRWNTRLRLCMCFTMLHKRKRQKTEQDKPSGIKVKGPRRHEIQWELKREKKRKYRESVSGKFYQTRQARLVKPHFYPIGVL